MARPVVSGLPVSRKRKEPFSLIVAGALAVVNWIWSFCPERSMKTPNLIVWFPITLVVLFAQAYTKPAQVPGYGPLSMVVRPSIVTEGSLFGSHFVPGKMNGYVNPAAFRLHRGPQDGSL